MMHSKYYQNGQPSYMVCSIEAGQDVVLNITRMVASLYGM
jgi:hypothetical protein